MGSTVRKTNRIFRDDAATEAVEDSEVCCRIGIFCPSKAVTEHAECRGSPQELGQESRMPQPEAEEVLLGSAAKQAERELPEQQGAGPGASKPAPLRVGH